ncbi:DNA ligase 1 [Rhododendron vialii]|uniref:DNA ligase 1 n=1 Tax=Rhododendron vialii TaxID=182163 RepID=UPI00265FE685|nr:DNA ligase 1 [Rhododendron vialii]XP_058199959.1 DNA ligase 1 [Rhododendron vialii]XP_058199961.1 DNA ligase 1 [Rhododendron vialii]
MFGCVAHTFLSPRLTLTLSPRRVLPPLISSLFPPKPFSLLKTPFSPNPKPSTTMSSRPSAFDALMSGARAAASKKRPQAQSSSPKKRKTPDSNPKNTQSISPKKSSDVSKPLEEAQVSNGPTSGEPNPNSNEEKSEVKKPRVSDPDSKLGLVTADESVALLKKKPKDFDPKSAAFWKDGERVPFLFLAKAFDAIDKESGRIAITEIVCNLLRTVIETTPDDLVAVVYLLGNKVAPAHEGVELGIGDASIIKALAEACGAKESQIKSKYQALGDLGLVAKASRSSQGLMRRPEALTVAKVFDTFRLIAKESGKDSQEKKKNHIKGLVVAATDCEPQYLIRLLQSKLRIGLAEQTLLAAVGQAAVYAEKHSSPPAHIDSPLEEAAKIVKQVYSVIPVYDKIVPALLTGGVWTLPKTCSFTPGVPIGPMLAKPTKGVSEILDKFQDMEFTCEYKYDGERAQIHYLENGSVEIYSRNAEWNTGKFPDVVVAVSRLKKSSVTSFVLDCEIVAYDREKKRIMPFQILSTRARKNVVLSDIKVDVCIFAFDILYLNGQPLMHEQLNVRREHLYKSFEEEPGYFQFATAITSNDLEEIQKFLEAAVDTCSEGLIIKTLSKDATYEPSKRSHNWLKLKKDYMESIGDSLDLVPIAAFHGRGKRTGVYGAFLLACYDSSNEEFQSICKIGTGFSESVLEERSASLRSKVIPKPKAYYRYGDSINPDVWFEPTEVWEVKAADLTISPVHRAAIGIVDSDKGISLRFPRLLRVREDKSPEQASSSDMVAEMYNAQKNNQRNNQEENEDD